MQQLFLHLGKRSIKRSCSLIFWGLSNPMAKVWDLVACYPLMLTLSCIKKQRKHEVQLHISYELYRISEITWSFFVLYSNRSFREGFFSKGSFFLGSKWASSAGSHVAGGRFLSGEGKVFFFNFWWVAKNYKSLFFWWAIKFVTRKIWD